MKNLAYADCWFKTVSKCVIGNFSSNILFKNKTQTLINDKNLCYFLSKCLTVEVRGGFEPPYPVLQTDA